MQITDKTTGLRIEVDFSQLTALGTYKNNWRERTVTLWSHPTDETKVISVGVPFNPKFNSGEPIVCVENRSDYRHQLLNNDWRDYN